MNEIVIALISALATILTGTITGFISYKTMQLKEKVNNQQFSSVADKVNILIADCIKSTNQTYVDSLKESNSFDISAQKEAFNKSFDSIMLVLSDLDKKKKKKNIGDLGTWITTKIQSYIKTSKNIK